MLCNGWTDGWTAGRKKWHIEVSAPPKNFIFTVRPSIEICNKHSDLRSFAIWTKWFNISVCLPCPKSIEPWYLTLVTNKYISDICVTSLKLSSKLKVSDFSKIVWRRGKAQAHGLHYILSYFWPCWNFLYTFHSSVPGTCVS